MQGTKEPDGGIVWTTVPCLCAVSCGYGYFCHTTADACIDDADCPAGGSCVYDLTKGHWTCAAVHSF
jgi:hypothetical protein